MSQSSIMSALIQALIDSAVMPTERMVFEGEPDFLPDVSQSFAAVYFLPTGRDKIGLVRQNSDISTGLMQVTLHYPMGNGRADMMSAVDALLAYFEPRQRFDGVEIRKAQSGRIESGNPWNTVNVDIYYTLVE